MPLRSSWRGAVSRLPAQQRRRESCAGGCDGGWPTLPRRVTQHTAARTRTPPTATSAVRLPSTGDVDGGRSAEQRTRRASFSACATRSGSATRRCARGGDTTGGRLAAAPRRSSPSPPGAESEPGRSTSARNGTAVDRVGEEFDGSNAGCVHVATPRPGRCWGGAQTRCLRRRRFDRGSHVARRSACCRTAARWRPGTASTPAHPGLAALRRLPGSGASPQIVAPGTGAPSPASPSTAVGNAVVGLPHGAAAVVVLDGSGPDLTPDRAARAASRAFAVDLSVAAVDRWSALAGTPQWVFGDGATGSGAAAQHVFAGGGHLHRVGQPGGRARQRDDGRRARSRSRRPRRPRRRPTLHLGKVAFAVKWKESRLSGRLVDPRHGRRRGRGHRHAGAREVPPQRCASASRPARSRPASAMPANAAARTLRAAPRRQGRHVDARGRRRRRSRSSPPSRGRGRPREDLDSRRGPDGASFTGRVRALHVSFHFAALPRAGRALHMDIRGPGGIGASKAWRGRPVAPAASSARAARCWRRAAGASSSSRARRS